MADFYSYVDVGPNDDMTKILPEMADLMRSDGATFLRATMVDKDHRPAPSDDVVTGLWMEGWLTRPDDQGAFNPPLTTI